MSSRKDIVTKYNQKIKSLSQELAEELLAVEPELEKRFVSLDADILEILREVGNNTMEIIGSSLSEEVKKNLPNVNTNLYGSYSPYTSYSYSYTLRY